MRRLFFFAVAAATLALMSADQAQAGGRRTRYYSYGGTNSTVTQRSTSQAAPANTAQSNTIRRYSYAPAQGSTSRYSYSPGYSNNRSWVMGSTPYNQNYWRADRKIKGY